MAFTFRDFGTIFGLHIYGILIFLDFNFNNFNFSSSIERTSEQEKDFNEVFGFHSMI